MQRRDLCKFLAIAAASRALPTLGQAKEEENQLRLPSGFNEYTRDYGQFCALPPEKRVFYHVSGSRIVEEKLDNAGWKPNGGDPPKLLLPRGWWDNVPLESPIDSLVGEGPYKPTWDSLLQYEAPGWYSDAKFGIWAHWSPQCVPEASIGTPAICTSRARGRIDITLNTTGHPRGLDTKTFARSGHC